MLPTAFVEASARLAPAASILVSAAPLPTIQKFHQQQSVGSNPLLPYSAMAANCCLWSIYGILQKQSAISIPNLCGFALSLYYMQSFIQNYKKQNNNNTIKQQPTATLPGTVQQHVTTVAAVTILSVLLAGIIPARVYGNLAVACCILLFASPLAALQTVLREKSAASIPFAFTIASVVNCFLWTVSGVFKFRDVNLILPNVLGLSFGLAQVVLKLVYSQSSSSRQYRYKPSADMATP